MRVPRGHHWIVIVWAATTIVGATVVAIEGADEDIDPGDSILAALGLVLVSGLLLSLLAYDYVQHRKRSGYPPSVYGLWDFIKDTWHDD